MVYKAAEQGSAKAKKRLHKLEERRLKLASKEEPKAQKESYEKCAKQAGNAQRLNASKYTENWVDLNGACNKKVNGVENGKKGTLSNVRIQVDEDSCNAYLLVGHVGMKDNISPYTLVHTVNGQKIKFLKYGRDGFWGSSIYKAQSQKGQKFFLDQFIKKSEVVIDFWPKTFKGKYKYTFSAKGFTKAFNSFVNECKSGGGAI